MKTVQIFKIKIKKLIRFLTIKNQIKWIKKDHLPKINKMIDKLCRAQLIRKKLSPKTNQIKLWG